MPPSHEFTVRRLGALEILDSRGRPTVLARCVLESGATASASVPSGASTGSGEAVERRDGDRARYGGLGCRGAVASIEGEIAAAIRGRAFASQAALDAALVALDGTADRGRLGANALLAVSIACARAAAAQRGLPLHEHLAELLPDAARRPPALPRLTVNLFSGGKHAGAQVPIQDVLLVPVAALTIDDGLAAVHAVYQSAIALIARRYGARPLRADEGGLAPPFPSAEAVLDDAVDAIRGAGLEPGRDMALAVDVAATHFYRDGKYALGAETSAGSPGRPPSAGLLDSNELIARLESWVARYPIVSLEDGLAEDDWASWPELRRRIAGRAIVVGDDLLCTQPARVRRAIACGAADALLLKANQVGTLTEAAEACALARQAGWSVTASARSGETEDDWLADLAVGWRADQIKVGSVTQSERLAKYNRLLAIERATGWPVTAWPRPRSAPQGAGARRPRVLLFDLGGVLVEWLGVDAVLALAAARGVRIDREAARLFWVASPRVRAFETGRASAEEFARGAVADLGLDIAPEDFLAEFATWVRAPLPGAFALLDELAPEFTLVCLSNTNSIHRRRILDEFGLAARLHRAYASCDIGKVKPDREAFEHVLADIPCAAGEVVFFDDNPEMAAGAAAAGIEAYCVSGVEGVRDVLRRKGWIA